MTDENTEIFLNFWQTYQWPEAEPISYRLYYDDKGQPVEYSAELRPGKYVELTAEQFAVRDCNVVVRDGQLIKQAKKSPTQKLTPASTGVSCHPCNVAIVVDPVQKHVKWNTTLYENS